MKKYNDQELKDVLAEMMNSREEVVKEVIIH